MAVQSDVHSEPSGPSGPPSPAPNPQPNPQPNPASEQTFQRAVRELLQLEGVDSNDPDDTGGLTRYGITAGEWLSRHGGQPPKPLRDITPDDARAFYRRWYWQEPGFERVCAVAPLVAWELFEAGVNCGPGTAVKFLQRALNFLDAAGLTEDGGIGTRTLWATRAFLAHGREHESLLVLAQNGEQYLYYRACVDARPVNRKFAAGWMKRTEDDHA